MSRLWDDYVEYVQSHAPGEDWKVKKRRDKPMFMEVARMCGIAEANYQ